MQGYHVVVSPARRFGQSTKQAPSTGQKIQSGSKAHLTEQQQGTHRTKSLADVVTAADLQGSATEMRISGVATLDTTVSAPKPFDHAESAAVRMCSS